jgi:hypothetical protein
MPRRLRPRRPLVVCLLTGLLLVLAPRSGPAATWQSSGGQANIVLASALASLLQTRDTPWTLTKTGTVDGQTQTVTWTVTATPGAPTGPTLTVDGFLGVTNPGAARRPSATSSSTSRPG